MKFVYEGGKLLLKQAVKQAPKVIVPAVKMVPKVVRPGLEFTRAAVTGTPRWRKLGDLGAREATIGPFTRAGMQTRYYGGKALRAAAVRGPSAAMGVVKYVGRTAIRDAVVTPYTKIAYGFQAFRAIRQTRGLDSVAERAIQAYIVRAGVFLRSKGLDPSATGVLSSYLRYPLYVEAARGFRELGGRFDEAGSLYRDASDSAKAFSNRAIDIFRPTRPVAVVEDNVPNLQQPVPAPAPVPAHVPIAPPPVPARPRYRPIPNRPDRETR